MMITGKVTSSLCSLLMDDAYICDHEKDPANVPFWVVCTDCADKTNYCPGISCAMHQDEEFDCWHQGIPIHSSLRCDLCQKHVHLDCSVIKAERFKNSGGGIANNPDSKILCYSCFKIQEQEKNNYLGPTEFVLMMMMMMIRSFNKRLLPTRLFWSFHFLP